MRSDPSNPGQLTLLCYAEDRRTLTGGCRWQSDKVSPSCPPYYSDWLSLCVNYRELWQAYLGE